MRSLLWMGFLCVLLVACEPSTSGPSAPAAVSELAPEASLVLEAFNRLARDTFQLTRTLVVLDAEGRLLGQDQREGSYRPDTGLYWVRVNRKGQFPAGPFGQAVSDAPRTPLTVVQLLWPHPLPFLQPRQRDSYRFQRLPDTLFLGLPVTRLLVLPATVKRAASASLQGVLYLKQQHLVGAELEEAWTTLFGTERRYLSVWLHPADGRLLREQLLIEVDPPTAPPYRFCLETQYVYPDRAPVERFPPPYLRAHDCLWTE
ncbi:hypothetical protein [Rhodothermus profundi]|uniref:Lipoprotein n=1 Tax=Rhodothermus profundi TaxID=633813 RepID=A0A1M6UV33_9BACT|nr:hypothetical protein [Rhodothermus profundi]SHK73035.1 hypothetical protein SAMN04488087_1876 [Rhodothermus profundi]